MSDLENCLLGSDLKNFVGWIESEQEVFQISFYIKRVLKLFLLTLDNYQELSFGTPSYLFKLKMIFFRENRLSSIAMGLTSKSDGKFVMTRSIKDITFNNNMAALDFQPSRKEETFLQLIRLEMFVTMRDFE